MNAMLLTLQRNRDARIAAANNAAYNVAKAKDAEFQYNLDAPYKDKKQEEAVLRQQAEQSKSDAINTIASTAANYGIATSQAGQYGSKDSGGGMFDGMDKSTGGTAPLISSVQNRQKGAIVNPDFQAPKIQYTAPAPPPDNYGYDPDNSAHNWRIVDFDEYGNPIYR
jgi:hypothetical protein